MMTYTRQANHVKHASTGTNGTAKRFGQSIYTKTNIIRKKKTQNASSIKMKIWERNGKCKQQKCQNDPAKASARQSKEMCEIQEGLRRDLNEKKRKDLFCHNISIISPKHPIDSFQRSKNP